MSGEYLAQSKHQISANRLHKKCPPANWLSQADFFGGNSVIQFKQPDVPVFLVTSGCFI